MPKFTLTIDEEQLDVLKAALVDYLPMDNDECGAVELDLQAMLETLDASAINDLTS